MGDEDPDSFILQAIAPLYEKCANVKGKASHLLMSGFVLSRGSRQEHAYAKMHLD